MLDEFDLLVSVILVEDSFSQLSRQQPKNGEGTGGFFFFLFFFPPFFLFPSPSFPQLLHSMACAYDCLIYFGIFADGLSLSWEESNR